MNRWNRSSRWIAPLLLTCVSCVEAPRTSELIGTTEGGAAAAETSGTSSESGDGSSSTTRSGTTGAGPSSTEGSSTTTGDDGTTGASGESSDASGSSGEESDTGRPPQPLPCCSPEPTSGCQDASVEVCVCDQDPYCCSSAWDIACVTEVEAFDCGACGTQDEIATCEALCTTFVTCAPELGHTEVEDCVELECLGLLDQAQSEGQACLEALAQYNACIGLLDCQGFADYVDANPPNAFPCMGFQNTMFQQCPFALE